MAKDLPYFKFFCSEWNDGSIALENYKTQGLFINICSYYWSNECEMEIKTFKKKFRNNLKDIDYLINEGLIISESGYIYISFLDEQLQERVEISEKNRLAGRASAEKRRLKKEEKESNVNPTPVEIPFNEKSTIKKRKEEKREEKKREELIFPFNTESFLESWDLWKQFKKEQFKFTYKSNISEQAALKEIGEISNNNEAVAIKIIQKSISSGYRGLFPLKTESNGNSKNGQGTTVDVDELRKRAERIKNMGS